MADISPLRRAVIRILTPLVRILLRHGVSYGTFSDLAKQVFTQVAFNDFKVRERKPSISRVSVLTGLNRKAVKEILDKTENSDIEADETYNRAARVIAGWRRDNQFRTPSGEPDTLPFTGETKSFSALVKKYSGDMPPRAVLDELERTQAVTELKNGRIQLLVKAYLPDNDQQMKLHILGTDAALLINTIEHNMDPAKPQPHLQRKVLYDNLPSEALSAVREQAASQGQALLEKLDTFLAQNDRDSNPKAEGTGRYTAGVGIYYFEEQTDNES